MKPSHQRCWFMSVLAISTIAVASGTNRFEIPKDKADGLTCRSLALAQKQGSVNHQDLRKVQGGFHYLFNITTPDGSQWEITCDGTSRSILRVVEITAPSEP